MREIKFRAWDKKHKRWLNLRNYCIVPDVHGVWFLRTDKGHALVDDAELSQFIGLKDKNDKDIYEADILRVDWNDKRYPPHNVGPVEWDDEEASWKLGEGGSPKADAENHMEVIGNVWENPELISKEV